MAELTQKQVWNEIAQDWKNFREKPREEVEEFVRQCEGKLLDLGCGSGRHFIKKEGLEMYGVDFSEKMIELAKKNANEKNLDIELKTMQDENLPYNDRFFDNLLCIAVLHCVETKEKRIKLLEEIKRVLKNNGKALIQVWSKNHNRIKNKGKDAIIPWTIGNKKFERYYYIYDLEEIKQEITGAGLRILEEKEDENIQIVVTKK